MTPAPSVERAEAFPYCFAWGAGSFRFGGARKGHACRVIARLPMNSALVEWESGGRDVISRNALRKRPQAPGRGR